MSELNRKIEKALQPILEQHGAFLVELRSGGSTRQPTVEVFVDTDSGISISDCAEIGRELGKALEIERILDSSYRLEVSSPGLDRPLRLLRQYTKNVGRKFGIRYTAGDSTESLVGTLKSVEGSLLTFEADDGKVVPLSFETIIESKEQLLW
jgi:ribosome maturation factor RimP